jgi:hypothetical protein
MDTSMKTRITYPIRTRYGYVSDTPLIRILGVSDFLLFSQMLDTPSVRIWPADTRSHEQSGGLQHEGEQKDMSPARAWLLACFCRPPNRRRFGLRRSRLDHRRRRIDPAAVDSTSTAADWSSTTSGFDLRRCRFEVATVGSTSVAVDSSSAAVELTLRA